MSVYAGTTPSSGRRAGRAAARHTNSVARSSGRRSRTKKNQQTASPSSAPLSSRKRGHNHHNKLNSHSNDKHQRTVRAWTLFDKPLGGAGLIVPSWVPVDTLASLKYQDLRDSDSITHGTVTGTQDDDTMEHVRPTEVSHDSARGPNDALPPNLMDPNHTATGSESGTTNERLEQLDEEPPRKRSNIDVVSMTNEYDAFPLFQ